MHYEFTAIPDTDIPTAVDPGFQHVLQTYASEPNLTGGNEPRSASLFLLLMLPPIPVKRAIHRTDTVSLGGYNEPSDTGKTLCRSSPPFSNGGRGRKDLTHGGHGLPSHRGSPEGGV